MDNSDEDFCSLLVTVKGYDKKVAPFTIDPKTGNIYPAKIHVSINLQNIIEISERNHKITFKFGISLEWYENRASYQNLKEKVSFNALSDEEIKNVWTPYLIYANTDNNEAATILDMVKTTMAVTREGPFKRSGMDVADEIEIFSGHENKLTLNQTYSKEFQCTYLIQWFPFDTQVLFLLNSVI